MRFERGFTIGLIALTAGLFIALNVVHALVLTPAAGGLTAPDLVPFGYNADGLNAWLTAMDDTARERFIGVHTLTLDLIFPFLFSWSLYRLLVANLSKLPRFMHQARWLKALLPLLLVLPYLVFDMVENMTVMAMLSTDQLPTPATAVHLQTWTVLKYAGVVLAAISLVTFWLAARRMEMKNG